MHFCLMKISQFKRSTVFIFRLVLCHCSMPKYSLHSTATTNPTINPRWRRRSLGGWLPQHQRQMQRPHGHSSGRELTNNKESCGMQLMAQKSIIDYSTPCLCVSWGPDHGWRFWPSILGRRAFPFTNNDFCRQ